MKQTILAGVAVIAIATAVFAQGTLSLNTATGTKPRITVAGVNAVAADNIWVQVLVAGATSLSGAGANPVQLVLGGANAGLFSKGIVTVNGKPAGTAVDVTIRAWDKDFGATYEMVPDGARASTILVGFVLGRVVVDCTRVVCDEGSIVPAFTGLNIPGVPEPSTFAVAAIGFGALVWIGRKKSVGS